MRVSEITGIGVLVLNESCYLADYIRSLMLVNSHIVRVRRFISSLGFRGASGSGFRAEGQGA